MDIGILGIADVQWKGKGNLQTTNGHINYSCAKDAEYRYRGSKEEHQFIPNLCGYTCEDKTEDFYHQLEEALQTMDNRDVTLILGDLNAKVGEGTVNHIVGDYGLGNRNERGQRSDKTGARGWRLTGDLAILVTANDEQALMCRANEALTTVEEWMTDHRPELMTRKAEALILKNPRKRESIIFRVQGTEVKPRKILKYLSIILDTHGTFECHVAAVAKKAEARTAILVQIMPNVRGPTSRKREMMVRGYPSSTKQWKLKNLQVISGMVPIHLMGEKAIESIIIQTDIAKRQERIRESGQYNHDKEIGKRTLHPRSGQRGLSQTSKTG
ncbi:hypothetical protein ILUMI_20229 [Ignelater luminosus]|uniref:Endonuclease/exonuclease/phosphatase domain-containing protein n=1 Tax=Ignelater luminosus TaxID=2038154 RepID=A0A8K0G528_IGNLU|nr:hypothetical protein ILUMI_20229 [Ignelater luminosus]